MKAQSMLTCVALSASSVLALPTAPRVSWEVSTDGGATWSANGMMSAAGSVNVRGRLSWIENAATPQSLGAALVAFDGTLLNMDPADDATGFTRNLVLSFDHQVIVLTRSGSTGKIDKLGDDLEAGVDPFRSVQCGQEIQSQLGSAFVTDNPVTFFSYSYFIGGADHTVSIGSILVPSVNNAVRIYLTPNGGTSGGGQFSRAAVAVDGATIQLITPAPGALAALSLGGVLAARRRRR